MNFKLCDPKPGTPTIHCMQSGNDGHRTKPLHRHLHRVPLAILTDLDPPAHDAIDSKPAAAPLRYLIHPPDAPAATAYTLPPNGVLVTKFIVSDLVSGVPKYWWTHKAGNGIRVMRAPVEPVDDLEAMCCVSKVDKDKEVVAAIRRPEGASMFTSKWVLEGGAQVEDPVEYKYKCKDTLTDGCKVVFTTKDPGAAYPEVRVIMYLKDGIMTVQVDSKEEKGKVVVAAWMRKDGEMRIAGGVDVEEVIAMFAQAHQWLKSEFFVWQDALVSTRVKY